MKAFLLRINRQHLFLFFSWVLIVALVYSPYVLSLSMIGMLAVSVFHLEPGARWRFGLNPDLCSNVRRLIADPALMAVTIGFFLVLVSGLVTQDFSYWLDRLRLKLPFLLLPFAFASVPSLSGKQYLGIYYFLLLILLLTCIGIGVNYLLNFEQINALLKTGQAMPTPRNHIRFSLMLALGIIGGGILYRKAFFVWYPWERYLILGTTLFLFFFIHLLSVRSGLLVLYAAISLLSLRYVYLTRRYLIGLGILAGLLVLPVAAYYAIPSFKARIDYARYDMWMYRHGQGGDNSDSGRITSLKIGIQIGNEHPLTGVGAGNLKQEVHRVYAVDYPQVKEPKMPHNQLVSVYAGTGLIGLSVFLFAFFFPLIYRRNYRDPIFFSFHIIVLFSFMTENTIENSIGVAFYVFFLLTGINHLNGQIHSRRSE